MTLFERKESEGHEERRPQVAPVQVHSEAEVVPAADENVPAVPYQLKLSIKRWP